MTNLTSTIFKHDGSDQAKECIVILNQEMIDIDLDRRFSDCEHWYYGYGDTGKHFCHPYSSKDIVLSPLFTILTPSEFLKKLKEK